MLEDSVTLRRWREDVDTVVFSGDWIPDHELARQAGVTIDPGTRGPATDASGRTNIDTLYAAGNLMHPVESADVAALWAREVADTVVAELEHRPSPSRPWLQLATEDPVAWVWPNRLLVGETLTRLQLRTRRFTPSTTLQALSPAGDLLASGRLSLTTPNRSLSAPVFVRTALGTGGAQFVRLV